VKNGEYFLEMILLICGRIIPDKFLGNCEDGALFRRVHFSCIQKKKDYKIIIIIIIIK